ncbi:dihydroneopterin aldolase [bacterium]|nr:dihydroneopterin aldolase [candidate division CSSED10-310 bacterium]
MSRVNEDVIVIKDLLVRGIIGINTWERQVLQDIIINLTIHADLRKVGDTDEIKHGVNYRSITKRVIELVEKARRFTVEALAADIAKICLAFEGVTSVRISVEKPGALRFARSVGVVIEREAADFE